MPRMPTNSAQMALANCAVVLASSTHLSFELSCLSSGWYYAITVVTEMELWNVASCAFIFQRKRKIFSSIRAV